MLRQIDLITDEAGINAQDVKDLAAEYYKAVTTKCANKMRVYDKDVIIAAALRISRLVGARHNRRYK